MFSRSDSFVLTIPTNNYFHQQTHFDFRPIMTRNTEPEIFTFERIPEPQQPFQNRAAPARARKRNTRVQYPSQVRKYLPPAEKSPVKRWLIILCLVVFMQIYTEEGSVEPEVPTFTEATTYNVLSFQSAEEQARQMTGNCPENLSEKTQNENESQLLNYTCTSAGCEDDVSARYQRTRRTGYVMALLYPVYHKLGAEN